MALQELLQALSNVGPGATRSDVADELSDPITAEGSEQFVKGVGSGMAGMPVDLTTALLRPFGYDIPPEQTVGSSEWFGRMMDADPNDKRFQLGTYASPDAADTAKGAAGLTSLAASFFAKTPGSKAIEKGLGRNTYLERTDTPNEYKLGENEGITPLNIDMNRPLVADISGTGKNKPKQWELDLAEAFNNKDIDKKKLLRGGPGGNYDGVVIIGKDGVPDYMTISPGQINTRREDQLLQDALDFKGEDHALGAQRAYANSPDKVVRNRVGKDNWHPISDTSLKVKYDDMTSKQSRALDYLSDELELMQPEDMIDEWVTTPPWDRSSKGQTITEVNGKPLAKPVTTSGGQGYITAQNDGVMASGKQVVEGYKKKIDSTGPDNVNLIPLTMSNTSTDFATDVANVHINRMPSYMEGVDPKLKTQFDEQMLNGSGKIKGQPNWPGLDDPDLLEKMLDPEAGPMRIRFLELMDKAVYKNGGFPDVGSSRKAVEQPDLTDVPNYHGGGVVGKVEKGAPMSLSDHPAYPYKLGGGSRGTLGKDLPAELLQADHIARRRIAGKPQESDNRSIELSKPIQKISPVLAQILAVHPGYKRTGQ